MTDEDHVAEFFAGMRERGLVPPAGIDDLEAHARYSLTVTKHTVMIPVARELLDDCPPLDMSAVLAARTRPAAPVNRTWVTRHRVRQYRQRAGHLAYRLIAGHYPEDYYDREDER